MIAIGSVAGELALVSISTNLSVHNLHVQDTLLRQHVCLWPNRQQLSSESDPGLGSRGYLEGLARPHPEPLRAMSLLRAVLGYV